jgi:hypothetical protein
MSYEEFRRQQAQQKTTPNMVQEPETTDLVVEEPAAAVPFDLAECWLRFAESLNEQGKPAEAILMKDAKPSQEGEVIVVEVAGSHQRDMMDQVRPVLLEHIRREYKKYLSLEVRIGAYVPTELKPYTDKEKLQAMMQQNPMIREMLERLKLRLR